MNDNALFKEISNCHLCQQQLPLPAKPILQFSHKSKILIAGQAPGEVTHHKGVPFNDKSGERLRQWLGLTEADFYDASQLAIVPMGFCYPGKGKSGDLPPIPLCANTWREQILTKLVNLELTVLVGKYAIDWHLAKLQQSNDNSVEPIRYKNITDIVSRWQLLLDHNMIALPHPSPRNNMWLKKNPWFEQDVLPVLKQRVLMALNN